MKRANFSALTMLAITFAYSSTSNNPLVTSADAISRAKQAWQSIYDKKGSAIYSKASAAKFEPYTATLEDGVWYVRGTVPVGYQGEILETTVRQSDGQRVGEGCQKVTLDASLPHATGVTATSGITDLGSGGMTFRTWASCSITMDTRATHDALASPRVAARRCRPEPMGLMDDRGCNEFYDPWVARY